MNDMHPTRWTLTVFLVLFAVLNLRPNKVEPTEWEPVAVLGLSVLAILLAILDLAIAKFAKSISKQQKRLRHISAAVLLTAATITLAGRFIFDIPGKGLEPRRIDESSATGDIETPELGTGASTGAQ